MENSITDKNSPCPTCGGYTYPHKHSQPQEADIRNNRTTEGIQDSLTPDPTMRKSLIVEAKNDDSGYRSGVKETLTWVLELGGHDAHATKQILDRIESLKDTKL